MTWDDICEHCRQPFEWDDQDERGQIPCPHCGQMYTIVSDCVPDGEGGSVLAWWLEALTKPTPGKD